MVSLKTFSNNKFNEIVVLGLRLVPLHPYDGCKWIRCRGELLTFMKRSRRWHVF